MRFVSREWRLEVVEVRQWPAQPLDVAHRVGTVALAGDRKSDSHHVSFADRPEGEVEVLFVGPAMVIKPRRQHADGQDTINDSWIAEKLVGDPDKQQWVVCDERVAHQALSDRGIRNRSVEH